MADVVDADTLDDLADRIRRWTGNRAHVIGRTPAEVARLGARDEPILVEWERDLVVVCGDRRALAGTW